MKTIGANRNLSRLGLALATAAGTALTAPPSEARITEIKIDPMTSEKPTFKDTAGVPRSFGNVGTYDKLRGKAFGEVDPTDRRNALITDIALAPRNVRGMVEYSMDIYILKPSDLHLGNHKLFMEVNNRGSKLFGSLNLSGGGNNPTTAADAGGAFLMNQGYSMAWNGWDISASGKDSLTITVPVATNPRGVTITGPSYEYIVFDNATTTKSTLAYAASSLDKTLATLTKRQHLTDPRIPMSEKEWTFLDERTIQLTGGRRSSRAGSTSSRTRRRIRSSPDWGSPRRATSSSSSGTRGRTTRAMQIRSSATCRTPTRSPSLSPAGT